uniref:Uncharacterized protein n=1 Tax=Manihot esculenta TaxID=3983 RepID=A0A2C9VP98_MANES
MRRTRTACIRCLSRGEWLNQLLENPPNFGWVLAFMQALSVAIRHSIKPISRFFRIR